MAQEYLAIKNTDRGIVAINTTVFVTIAKICVEEEKNVVLGDASYFKNAILCKIEDERLVINLNVKVNYNAKVNEVCSKLQTRIYDNVRHMCDCLTNSIIVNVNGFTF